MARLCGACLGLLVFSAMIVRGMLVGNAPEVILQRALIGLFGGTLLGCVAGWLASIVLADHPSSRPETSDGGAQVPAVGSIEETPSKLADAASP